MSRPAPTDVSVQSEAATLPPTRPADEASALPPRTEPSAAAVPGYENLAELGRGGMGVVYKARHVGLNRVVALKMILAGGHAGPDDLARFRGEAEAVARLKHPNVVQIYDIGEAGGLPYFSLEFVEGGSLDRKLAGTPLPPNEAAALVETLARAMAAAHAAGLVHRDLKPANVLLTADGTPKVTDFGLVKKLDLAAPGQEPAAGLTASGAILGTPSYMAPEQAGGRSKEIGPACDIYALGAILYECLTGRPPFRAATPLDTILQVVSEEPVPPRQLNARLPVDLETICLKCLMKEPRRRYATAQALAEDLRRFEEGRPIRARPVGTVERALKWVKRRPAVAAALVGGLLLPFGAGLFLAVAWASSKEAGEKAARDELDRFRGQVASEREQQQQQQQREDEERTRARQMAEARRQASRQLAKVAVLWDDYPQEALRLLEDARVFPPELHDSAWEGYHRLCKMDRQALQGNGPRIKMLRTTPDFKTMLTLDDEDTVRLCGWEETTLKERHNLRLPTLRDLFPPPRGVNEPERRRPRWSTVSMSADGTLLAYSRTMTSCRLRDHDFFMLGPLGNRSVPPQVLEKLNVVKNKVFDSREQLSSELTKILNKDEIARFQEVVLKQATAPFDAVEFHDFKSNKDHATENFGEPVLAPDGKMFALRNGVGSVNLCDAATGGEKYTIHTKDRSNVFNGVVFAPDGKTLALWSVVNGAFDSVQLWDVGSYRRRAEFAGQLREFPARLAFSPDGMFLAAYSALPPDKNGKPQPPEVLVWDVPPGE